MRRPALILLIAVAAALGAGRAAEVPTWRHAAPGHAWSFPEDFAAHPGYRTEWWYVTGNLETGAGDERRDLGFQLTFFRIGLDPAGRPPLASDWAAADLVMAHASVTDPEGPGHVFSEVLWRAVPLLGGFGAPGDTTLAWCRAPAGTDARWSLDLVGGGLRLRARDDRRGLRFDLRCTPTRPPVFHGDGGYSPKTADGSAGSLYFSHTRMAVAGVVHRDGDPLPVTGASWLDREIFTSTLGAGQVGWDWLSLRLDDGRDLMLYRLRGREPADDFALGTLVDAAGRARTLPAEAWSLEPGRTWTSPATGSVYPVRWTLRIPGEGLALALRPLLDAQENVSERSGVHYWEGAVAARPLDDPGGEPLGRGYVELTGYGEDSRPPI